MRWPIKPAAAAYVLLLLAALFLLATQAQRHSLLVTDLAELLPADAQMSTVERNAQAQSEAALNRQMVMLVGAAERENAEAGASALAALWRQSGVFESVTERTQPDMAAWQQAALPLRLALLPAEVAAQWPQQAPAYFRQRAEDMANPFATPALLPPTQDWLGLSRFMLPKIQQSGHLQWDEHSGMLWAEHDGRHWVLVRAELPPNSGVADAQTALLPLLQQTQQAAVAGGQTVQIAGGAVFAAEARAAAERESRWMSMAGVGLTLLLLLAVFRRWRILLLLLPLACGVLLGLAACVAVFGHVHVLTVVIGTSLIGVLIDFPLHWLTPAVLSSQWRARPALRQVLPVFVVSLAVTVSGYALLLFTPLPVLRQTAVFSAVALVGAFAATALLLPPLFSRWQPRPNRRLAAWAQSWQPRLPRWRARAVRYGLLPLLLLALAGLWRSNWHDDIRQWVHLSPQWLAQAQAVGRISGVAPAGQFFLVEAGSEDALLQTDAELSKRLAALPSGSLAGFQSLSQWVLPQAAQRQLQAHMRQMAATPALWAEMSALGVPDEAMRQALLQTAVLPPVSLSGSLNNPLAQAWQPLYLGQVAPGRFVGMVRLNGVHNTAALQDAAAAVAGVHWVDKPARLNTLFHQTRNQAAWLKLVSFALAWLALMAMLGRRRGSQVLAVPLASAVLTVAVLGWLGQPVSLFAMFGLLLVSAIGVDYALYIATAKHDGHERLIGMLLAAATTLISFVLLGFSATPAVAGFGLAVAIGVVWNVLLATWLLPYDKGLR